MWECVPFSWVFMPEWRSLINREARDTNMINNTDKPWVTKDKLHQHFNDVFLPVSGSKIKCEAKATQWHLMMRWASVRLCYSMRFSRMIDHLGLCREAADLHRPDNTKQAPPARWAHRHNAPCGCDSPWWISLQLKGTVRRLSTSPPDPCHSFLSRTGWRLARVMSLLLLEPSSLFLTESMIGSVKKSHDPLQL